MKYKKPYLYKAFYIVMKCYLTACRDALTIIKIKATINSIIIFLNTVLLNTHNTSLFRKFCCVS
jgi:hypothetical protein